MNNIQRHFTILVIGENPLEKLERYDSSKNIRRTTVCKKETAEGELEDEKKLYKRLLEGSKINAPSDFTNMLELKLNELSSMTPDEYYNSLAEIYDMDEQTGELFIEENPYGKYDAISKRPVFSLPFITKKGEEVYTTKKGEVDWGKMHLTETLAYEIAWDTVMENKKPETDDEKAIYENMKNRTAYFHTYKTRDNYIRSNTSFWCYAVVDEDGWSECGDDQYGWVCNFFDKYIKELPDDTQLTIVEGYRKPEYE